MTFYEGISIAIAFAAVLAVLRETRELRLQLKSNYHQEYARRYTEIIRRTPYRAFEDWQFTLDDCLKEKPDFKVTARLYFWIIQEELDLHRKGRLPRGQWEIWKNQFRISMKGKCFQQVWEELKKVMAYPPYFLSFVDSIKAEFELEEPSRERTE